MKTSYLTEGIWYEAGAVKTEHNSYQNREVKKKLLNCFPYDVETIRLVRGRTAIYAICPGLIWQGSFQVQKGKQRSSETTRKTNTPFLQLTPARQRDP